MVTHTEKAAGKRRPEMGQPLTADQIPEFAEPPGQPNATSASPAERPASTEVVRSKIGHGRHRLTVRHRIVDVKTQLLAHCGIGSLAEAEKSPKPTPMLERAKRAKKVNLSI